MVGHLALPLIGVGQQSGVGPSEGRGCRPIMVRWVEQGWSWPGGRLEGVRLASWPTFDGNGIVCTGVGQWGEGPQEIDGPAPAPPPDQVVRWPQWA